MTPFDVERVIRGRFKNEFNHDHPISWPNRHFNPAKDAPDGTWIRVTVRFANTQEGEMGIGGVSERIGILYVDIFTLKNSGVKEAEKIAFDVERLFRQQSFDNLVFNLATTDPQGIDPVMESHHKTQVRIDFFAFTGDED